MWDRIYAEKCYKRFALYRGKSYICNRKNTLRCSLKGELPEWLMEQFAKLSTSNCRMSSNLILSAKRIQGLIVNFKVAFGIWGLTQEETLNLEFFES